MGRFHAVYNVTGDRAEAYRRSKDICYEQTVEFPPELVPKGFIADHIVGRIESFRKSRSEGFETVISFDDGTIGNEWTQCFNVLFGNISLKPGIRLMRIEPSAGLLKTFRGPRFGQAGLRRRLGVPKRPILSTALKPMGLSASDLADLAYRFALGGIDLIKDDHGLADQPYARFQKRVDLCAKAVRKANRETGLRCAYVPNVTAAPDVLRQRARFAKNHGAGGYLVSPALCGFDTLRQLADDPALSLPILAHPAFMGSFTTSPISGISHFALYGQMMRLAGADATIYPNYGGRFSFLKEECRSIALGCKSRMGSLKTIFPAPGGGMNIPRVPELMRFYGNDVLFLIGGGLFTDGPDVVENSRRFLSIVEKNVRP